MLKLIRKLFRPARIVSTRYQPAPKPTLENDFHKRLAAEIGWKRKGTAA